MSKQRGKGRAGGKGRGGDDEPEDSPKGRKGRVVEEETNDIPTRKKGGRRGKAEEDAVPKKGQKKVCIFAFISDQQQLFFFSSIVLPCYPMVHSFECTILRGFFVNIGSIPCYQHFEQFF